MTARPAAPGGKKENAVRPVATNRKAFHEYFVEEKMEAGLELTGTEVKSLREGRANLTDGWVELAAGQAWLHGVHVSPYDAGSYMNPDPVRKRRLLLHKREILKLGGKATEKGFTLIPLRAYFKNGRVKVEIGLARSGWRVEAKWDRFEVLEQEFHQRVREGYLRLASAEPRRFAVVAGDPDPHRPRPRDPLGVRDDRAERPGRARLLQRILRHRPRPPAGARTARRWPTMADRERGRATAMPPRRT